MANKLVSIIIPVYNVEKYLDECIKSCVNQTYSNLEIILVNDGSTDASAKICDDAKAQDVRIVVIHKENGGLSSARNVGIQQAKGDYMCFLDSDDWMNINAIDESLRLAVENDADIVFWSCIKEFTQKQVHYRVFNSFNEIEIFENNKLEHLKRRSVGLLKEEMNSPTKTDSFISAWGKLYKSSLIKDKHLLFLPTQLVGSEDVTFNIEAFFFSKKIIYMNKFYNHYRMFNENSLTKNHKNTLFIRYKNLYNHVLNFLKTNNVSDEYYESLNNRFALTLINNCLSISSPRYNVSLWVKFQDVNLILSNNEYYNALNKLDVSYLPPIWKLFFSLAKKKQYKLLLLITLLYRKMN